VILFLFLVPGSRFKVSAPRQAGHISHYRSVALLCSRKIGSRFHEAGDRFHASLEDGNGQFYALIHQADGKFMGFNPGIAGT
jgi:hypothetical protein